VAVLTFLTPQDGTALEWMTAQLCSGGLLLGAFFMATDYTTSPVTPRGQVLYGIGCGGLTVLLRYFGSYPDGVGWAILLMNCVVWILDRIGTPRRFGERPLVFTRKLFLRIRENSADIRFVLPHLPRSGRGQMPGEMYLDQIKKLFRNALALTLVTVSMGLVIYGVHIFTDLQIAKRGNQEEQAILEHVMPQAEYRTETAYRSPNAVSISAGYSSSELVGYCVEIQTPGFGGMLTMVVGVDLDGKVTGVVVTDHKETPDMGTHALEESYLDSFVGRSGTLRLDGSNSVDVVSGATITSKAIVTGVNQALSVIATLDSGQDVIYVDGEV